MSRNLQRMLVNEGAVCALEEARKITPKALILDRGETFGQRRYYVGESGKTTGGEIVALLLGEGPTWELALERARETSNSRKELS